MVYSFVSTGSKRFFTVPCTLTEKHLSSSSGEYVKVLLCILGSDGSRFNSAELAAAAGVGEQLVNDAVAYWIRLGLLAVDGEREVPQQSTAKVVAVSAPVRPEHSLRYSPKELAAELENNPDLKYLAEQYEKLKGRPIKDAEILSFINMTQHYEYPAQSLMLIMEYCSGLDKLSTAYMEALVKSWSASGITDFKDVEEKIISQQKLGSYENKLRKAFAIDGKLSKAQKQFAEKWQNEGIAVEMLEIAYDRCMDNKGKLSFPYIDAIIKSWAGKGITTPEQAENESTEFSAAAKKKAVGDKSSSSYDIGEWEKYAQNFDPNKR